MTERFQLMEQVGRGGMGVVWKARDTRTGEFVALKIPWEQYATDPAYMERLEREVEVTRRIDSPYVARTLGFGRREGRPFIAMEYVEGKSLRQILDEKGLFTWDEARPILRQVALGLDAAHKANVIHRDVKPSNILLTEDGTAKLVDFGIAKAADMAALTGSKTTLGTPAYMAPEGTPSPQADLYGLGCVAYEMLTGRQVFEGDTQQEVMLKHVRELPDLSALPGPARATVGALLQKKPPERLQAAERLASVLAGTEELLRRRRTNGHRLRLATAGGIATVGGVGVGGLLLAFVALGGSGDDGQAGFDPTPATAVTTATANHVVHGSSPPSVSSPAVETPGPTVTATVAVTIVSPSSTPLTPTATPIPFDTPTQTRTVPPTDTPKPTATPTLGPPPTLMIEADRNVPVDEEYVICFGLAEPGLTYTIEILQQDPSSRRLAYDTYVSDGGTTHCYIQRARYEDVPQGRFIAIATVDGRNEAWNEFFIFFYCDPRWSPSCPTTPTAIPSP